MVLVLIAYGCSEGESLHACGKEREAPVSSRPVFADICSYDLMKASVFSACNPQPLMLEEGGNWRLLFS
jgi:hypothetical protein